MSKRCVIACPPSGTGDRTVGIDGHTFRRAFSAHALTPFPQNAGLTGRHELDVESGWLERVAGGLEVWRG
ncbi:hypothetical protein [Streptomyces canus]|uniref:hypothetical protein n=1 Tax=Streptomyces canus TaxID=58343 RepID=UPI002E30F34D|nr:hypothetical protein [Streptomyces canus]